MNENLSEYDILVILYPNKYNLELVLILNPYDKKIAQYKANSIDEVKMILKEELPFCSQGHQARIHGGRAYIIDWEDLPSSKLSIKFPEDIDEIIS